MKKAFQIAKKVYHDYSFKEGNQHIASEYNLFNILRYCKSADKKKVLELGVGIGTILSLFQESEEAGFLNLQKYVGTETNEFCQQRIKENCLHKPKGSMEVSIFDHAGLITDQQFDFVVVDGQAPHLEHVVTNLLSPHAILIIEGYRRDQVEKVKDLLLKCNKPFSFFLRFSTWRNPSYGPFTQDFQAGHTVFYINPTQKEKTICKIMERGAKVRSIGRKLFDIRSWQ